MNKLGNHTIYPSAGMYNPAEINEHAPAYAPSDDKGGLSELQRNTRKLLKDAGNWTLADSEFTVRRHKLDDNTWQLTVINPKTRKVVLQAQGHGDTVLAHEENLARMAETLTAQGLTIRTSFDE